MSIKADGGFFFFYLFFFLIHDPEMYLGIILNDINIACQTNIKWLSEDVLCGGVYEENLDAT